MNRKVIIVGLTAVVLFNILAVLTQKKLDQRVKHTTIIWNDDKESIPAVGEAVYIEMIQNDTVYLSPNKD
jgi:hypothetical protein